MAKTENHKDILRKVFSDPVHGHIALHPACVAIIDTPQFQRLRNIKQLGGGYFVYPGASHNRFEHSLGVCYLAGEMARTLKNGQNELDIDDKDVLCVEIAGLCHDLGHGPFSHVFDNMVVPRVREDRPDWKHEDASKTMFEHMIEENPVIKIKGDLNSNDVTFIMNMICPPPSEEEKMKDSRWPKKAFLYEIVANKRSEVDVDKMDYIARDCLHLGIRSSFDHGRFIRLTRVIRHGKKMRLCVRDKEAFNVYQLFQTRHALHKKAYKHRVTSAVEYTLAEILIKAKDVKLIPGKRKRLALPQCIDDMSAYTHLTDEIFQQIRISSKKELKQSRDLLQALERRKLFVCVAESCPIANSKCKILKEDTSKLAKETKIKKELIQQLKRHDPSFLDDTITVQVVMLDFGKKDRNPVDELCFYTKRDIDTAIKIKSTEVSHLFPKKMFQEQMVRVFLKHYWVGRKCVYDHDRQYMESVCKVFEKWCSKNKIGCKQLLKDQVLHS
ncbi:deoxynucleoside triphosphate triphosphohydrolase SAMHD1-like [Pomacea canaliculata]|uniref:deoxynucleoside triphosphate triphosphohydrolase SAMHD1-like n=1 Tax=Pomacea canaliculata TaxID=400727 RepID=UPI000D725B4D|nr:deoxynucleoside triphosphate triphosphohydrolase SAMHD1-like [Pomacea canaliculata]